MLLVLELCCFEWFQNIAEIQRLIPYGFRAVLFRMVPKPADEQFEDNYRFRAVLFRMVPKQLMSIMSAKEGFRAVLFRMVPKRPLG